MENSFRIAGETMPLNSTGSDLPREENKHNDHGILAEAKAAASKLADECYEHPWVAGAAVATAAVGVGLAARGQISVLRNMGKDVLLIEDTPFMGKAFKSQLEAEGHRVTWLTSVSQHTPLTGLDGAGQKVVINPNRFKIAFVDGDLGPSYLQGPHLVDALRKSGVPSIGTSTIAEFNDVMRGSGAKIAADKPTVLAALVGHRLNLSEAIVNPARVQSKLSTLAEDLRAHRVDDLKRTADRLLHRFIEDP